MMHRMPLLFAAASLVLVAFSCSGGSETSGETTSSTSSSTSTSPTTTSPSNRCDVITASIQEAGFDGEVTVHCDATYAYIQGDTYPAHDKMTGITGTNEQVPVPAPGHESPIPLAPEPGGQMLTVDGALGVAVNGVPIYDYSSQGMLDVNQYDPNADTLKLGQLDKCNGHAGRGDDYHYHAAPTCLMESMKNKGPAAIVGWALDGYPIYGNDNPDGTPIMKGDLDVCNGQEDATFGRRYHTSDAPPYIVQCLTGKVDESKLPRVPPLDAQAGGGKPPGVPPQGGVQDLAFVEAPDGTRTMTYSYQGKSYHIQYKPSATDGCWDFEQQTVTNGGTVETATYCRQP